MLPKYFITTGLKWLAIQSLVGRPVIDFTTKELLLFVFLEILSTIEVYLAKGIKIK